MTGRPALAQPPVVQLVAAKRRPARDALLGCDRVVDAPLGCRAHDVKPECGEHDAERLQGVANDLRTPGPVDRRGADRDREHDQGGDDPCHQAVSAVCVGVPLVVDNVVSAYPVGSVSGQAACLVICR